GGCQPFRRQSSHTGTVARRPRLSIRTPWMSSVDTVLPQALHCAVNVLFSLAFSLGIRLVAHRSRRAGCHWPLQNLRERCNARSAATVGGPEGGGASNRSERTARELSTLQPRLPP